MCVELPNMNSQYKLLVTHAVSNFKIFMANGQVAKTGCGAG